MAAVAACCPSWGPSPRRGAGVWTVPSELWGLGFPQHVGGSCAALSATAHLRWLPSISADERCPDEQPGYASRASKRGGLAVV